MKVEFLGGIPWLTLVSLWLAYVLLGWYLSAYHIFWVVGAFVAGIALASAWQSLSCLEVLVKFSSRSFLAILMMLIFCVLFAIAANWSLSMPLIIIPFSATFLADLDMRFVGLNTIDRFLLLTLLAGFGLGVGEIIDIFLLPSSRY